MPRMLEPDLVNKPLPVGASPLAGCGLIHVVDDDDGFRQGIALLLKSAGYAVECYFSAEHFLEIYRPRELECVLLDLRMPGMTGLELQDVLSRRRIRVPLIVISAFAETPSVVRAVQNGAIDFLEKPVEDELLLAKVRSALQKDHDDKLRRGNLAMRLARLSSREREVLDLLVAAKTTLEIAHALAISPKTVEKHRLKVFEKLGVDSVPAVIRLVMD